MEREELEAKVAAMQLVVGGLVSDLRYRDEHEAADLAEALRITAAALPEGSLAARELRQCANALTDRPSMQRDGREGA
jgi:hypothetical protein